MSTYRRFGVLAIGTFAAVATLSACSSVATAEVGTCTNLDDLQGEITDIDSVSCDDAHDAEVFHVDDLDDGDFPGDEQVEASAQDMCYNAFEPYVGTDYEESELEFFSLPPNEETWDDAKDREVLCILGSADKVEESFEDSGM